MLGSAHLPVLLRSRSTITVQVLASQSASATVLLVMPTEVHQRAGQRFSRHAAVFGQASEKINNLGVLHRAFHPPG